MRATTQARLAIAATVLFVALLLGANAHLVAVAFDSQPACVLPEGGPAPAKSAC